MSHPDHPDHPAPAPRHRTGDAELDRRLQELLEGRVASAEDRDLLFQMLVTVVRMAGDSPDRLNLKITSAALREMRQAFRVFAPYHDIPKVTIFGSARTLPDDPLYVQTRDVAAALAHAGWMVVTGAGPGIMAAGAEGAGKASSIGVNIRLPFEQEANPFIAADPKLVSMKYFFTRKLMLMKESAGFVVLPGGFGTLDETFELLTLLQTGKAAPAPLVLLDVPGGTYWQAWNRFIVDELAGRGLVGTDDLVLCRITSDVDDAVNELLGFFRNYHSIRYVGSRLVVRLRAEPAPDEIDRLRAEFADICTTGGIEASGPLPAEMADGDHVDLPRIVLHFDRMNHGRLRALIDALNRLGSAPDPALPDPGAVHAAGTPPDTGGAPAPAAPDPALATLLGRAAGPDRAEAAAAAAGLAEILGTGGITDAQEHAVVTRLCHLATERAEPEVRDAVLRALGAASPAVGLAEVVDLLQEHRGALGREGTAVLLGSLDTMLAAAAARQPDHRRDIANLLRALEVGPTLDALGRSSAGAVADAARAARRRVDGLVAAHGWRPPSPSSG